MSQKQQANVCRSSTPTEYGNASPPDSAPTDDVSTGSDDVTEWSRGPALQPATEHQIKSEYSATAMIIHKIAIAINEADRQSGDLCFTRVLV